MQSDRDNKQGLQEQGGVNTSVSEALSPQAKAIAQESLINELRTLAREFNGTLSEEERGSMFDQALRTLAVLHPDLGEDIIGLYGPAADGAVKCMLDGKVEAADIYLGMLSELYQHEECKNMLLLLAKLKNADAEALQGGEVHARFKDLCERAAEKMLITSDEDILSDLSAPSSFNETIWEDN